MEHQDPASIDVNRYLSLKKAFSEYGQYISELKRMSDDELKSLNYLPSQIDAIRQYDGSERLIMAAAATMSGTLYYSSPSYNSNTNKTTMTVSAKVYWNGVPFLKSGDNFAIALKGSSADFVRQSSYCKITYPDGSITYSSNYSQVYGLGITYQFGISTDQTTVFTEALISYTGVAQGNVTVLEYAAAYAHLTYSIGNSIGLSISSTGSSISFSVSAYYSLMWNGSRVY